LIGERVKPLVFKNQEQSFVRCILLHRSQPSDPKNALKCTPRAAPLSLQRHRRSPRGRIPSTAWGAPEPPRGVTEHNPNLRKRKVKGFFDRPIGVGDGQDGEGVTIGGRLPGGQALHTARKIVGFGIKVDAFDSWPHIAIRLQYGPPRQGGRLQFMAPHCDTAAIWATPPEADFQEVRRCTRRAEDRRVYDQGRRFQFMAPHCDTAAIWATPPHSVGARTGSATPPVRGTSVDANRKSMYSPVAGTRGER